MKNYLAIVFFGIIIMIANLFTDKPEQHSSAIVIMNPKIVKKELEKRALINEVKTLSSENSSALLKLSNP